MKIKVDRENKAIIAYGGYRGKRIRAVAVCKEPVFDEAFGTELAKRKYKIKERYAKLRWHENCVSYFTMLKRKIDSMILDHNKCADFLDAKVQSEIQECEEFVNNYFAK